MGLFNLCIQCLIQHCSQTHRHRRTEQIRCGNYILQIQWRVIMSFTSYHPGKAETTTMTLFNTLGIPSNPLGAHLWIVAGVAPTMIYHLAETVKTDVGSICRLVGISRSTVARKLKTGTPLSTSQGTRIYGVVQAFDAALSLHEFDTTRALSWLHRRDWGLGGVAPAQLLNTPMGVQAVVDLVGRIQHGVCN
ncbi:antitoxin Xre/MbcA/ParS toxin-binding domain-containing protein [Aeromonas dhakensis]|uniref:antitoxin Xre/MbcA/ParS toxin-binding domain-containing protein n=1 Tax=Aeromonas dhakensis TaxID=196024 RepID=UPI0028C486E9|nr:antitoxin Xre/MbcA/ParS toxin-binding domain-containing protein [Aeromonas dhakensis]